MHAEQPTELPERQLLVVDTDDDFPVRPAVVDDAAEHVAARDPLIAVLVIVDLLLARRLLDDRLVPRLQERPLKSRIWLYISTISASLIVAMPVMRAPDKFASAWSMIASFPSRVIRT